MTCGAAADALLGTLDSDEDLPLFDSPARPAAPGGGGGGGGDESLGWMG